MRPDSPSMTIPTAKTMEAVRRRFEERENALSPYAARSSKSLGRMVPDPDMSGLRTEFQRDRDRILHTKAFRRLKHKTQVFIAPLGDHYVTRLTHTLEVTQIARTIARALNLNEDLTEAIGLGHDLGHTPFGHIGEQELDKLYPQGFHHSQQSLRLVDELEREGAGLNLMWEVRRGIVSHSKPRGDLLADSSLYAENGLSLEAQVCRVADAVAYVNHDLGDAFRASILREQDLPTEVAKVLGSRHSERLNTLVSDIVESSWAASGELPLPKGAVPAVSMSPRVLNAINALREFLFEKVYIPAGQGKEGQCAREMIHLLYDYFTRNPERIPQEYRLHNERPERVAVDYIAGMTDRFALRAAEEIRPGIAHAFRDRFI